MKRFIIAIMALLVFATSAEAVTLAQEIARCREYLYETSSDNSVYTDAQITEAINSAQDLLSNLLSYSSNHENIINSSIAVTATGEVCIAPASLPVSLKKIISYSIIWPGGTASSMTPCIQIKPEEYPFRFYKGTTKDPVYFYTAGYLWFYPANPGGVMGHYIVGLKAYTRLVNTTDTVTVQDRYLNFLTLASVWYVLQADNQTNRAGNIYKLLTDLITIENTAMVNSNVVERVQGAK